MYAKPLFIGEMNKALNYNHRFPTTIPKELGLPPPTKMPEPNPENLAEGTVVKPWDVETPFVNRPMVKHKIEEFFETDFHSAPTAGGKQYDRYCLSTVNRNRIDAAISKIGDTILTDTSVDITPLHTMIMDDIRSEIDFDLISDSVIEQLKKKVRTEINSASVIKIKLANDGKVPKGSYQFRYEEGASDPKAKKKENPEEKK